MRVSWTDPASLFWSSVATYLRPGPEAAAHHEVMAREYLRLAELILIQEKSRIAAGALLYESAKQCVNAVANLQRMNPVTTRAKRQFLIELSERGAGYLDIYLNWRAANLLHVNADRGLLSDVNFDDAWESSHAFINQMLQIYARDQ